MSNVQPVVNPSKNKDTTKSPNNTPVAKDDTLNKKSIKRKPSFVAKIRRASSATIEHVANNIGEADIGVDGHFCFASASRVFPFRRGEV